MCTSVDVNTHHTGSFRGRLVVTEVGRTLRVESVPNTRRSEYPEAFCRGLGYAPVGVVPGYTLARYGDRHDTVIRYRELSSGHAAGPSFP